VSRAVGQNCPQNRQSRARRVWHAQRALARRLRLESAS
jgi:hypothetical protein